MHAPIVCVRLAPALGLVFVVLSAGCIGTAAASAQEVAPKAESAAKAWDPSAQLAGVLGMEGDVVWEGMATAMRYGAVAKDSSRPENAYWGEAGKDGKVGDGKAKVWVYYFTALGKSQGYVVVERNGETEYQGPTTPPESPKLYPLGAWNIDSDEALRIAKEASAGLREGAESERFAVMEALMRETPSANPVWAVMGAGGDAGGAGMGYVKLDAVTGVVFETHGGFQQTTWAG